MALSIILATLLAAPAADASAAPAGDAYNTKKVCKRIALTGTRLGGKAVCKTQAQWDYNAKVVQDDAGAVTDKPGYGPGSN